MIKVNNLKGHRFYFKEGKVCGRSEVIVADRRDPMFGVPIIDPPFGAILLVPGDPGEVLIEHQIESSYTVMRHVTDWHIIPVTPSRALAQKILDEELPEENWDDDYSWDLISA